MEKADESSLTDILTRQDVLRFQKELEAANSQLRQAIASERNAKYMFWSVIFAAASAAISLATTVINVFFHH
jgi:hypothetical protein